MKNLKKFKRTMYSKKLSLGNFYQNRKFQFLQII